MASNIHITEALHSQLRSKGLYFHNNGQKISPWHDIPLYADQKHGILNIVVEIPRGTNAKMEITKEVSFNPITQDIKKGKPRELADISPFRGYPCNYGAIPQTWENPNAIDPHTGVPGDDDPLDVCEIGSQVAQCGEIKIVKPLGAFAVLDEGETDWKIIAIDIADALSEKLTDIGDVENHLPGFLESLKTWYCNYKVPDGNSPNSIGLDGKLMDRQYVEPIMLKELSDRKQICIKPHRSLPSSMGPSERLSQTKLWHNNLNDCSSKQPVNLSVANHITTRALVSSPYIYRSHSIIQRKTF